VYGTLAALRLHALDADGSTPGFEPLGVSQLEGINSHFGTTRVAGQTLLVTRVEREPGRPLSGPDARARIMLDAFEVAPNAGGTPRPPINVPGYPFSATPSLDGLISAERTEGGLVLHRSELRDGAARVVETQPLPDAHYDDATNDGSWAFLLAHEGDGCQATTRLYGLDAGAPLSVGTPAAFGGEHVQIQDLRGDRLLLSGRGGWLGLLDVGQPEAPALERLVVPGVQRYQARLSPEGTLLEE
jgi:hypothetical protein